MPEILRDYISSKVILMIKRLP